MQSVCFLVLTQCAFAIIQLPFWHPDVVVASKGRQAYPSAADHPDSDSLFLADNSPNWPRTFHPAREDLDTNLRARAGLPDREHEGYLRTPIRYDPFPRFAPISLPFWHPDIQTSYLANNEYPASHPPLQALFVAQGTLPDFHPSVDTLLNRKVAPSTLNYLPLSITHPNLNRFAQLEPVGAFNFISIPYWHPNIQEAFDQGEALPDSHPDVNKLLQDIGAPIPDGHPAIESLYGSQPASVLPSFHPALLTFVRTRSRFTNGMFLAIVVAFVFLVFAALRAVKKFRKSKAVAPGGSDKFTLTDAQVASLVEYEQRLRAGGDDNVQFEDVMDLEASRGAARRTTVFHGKPKPAGPTSTTGTVESPLHVDDDPSAAPPPPPRPLPPSDSRLTSPPPPKAPRPPALAALGSTKPSALPPKRPGVRRPTLLPDNAVVPSVAATEDLPGRNLRVERAKTLHARHVGPALYEDPTVAGRDPPPSSVRLKASGEVDKKERSSCGGLVYVCLHCRVPHSDWQLGDVLFVLLYVGLNVAVLLVHSVLVGDPPGFQFRMIDLTRAFGSLAAANAMILVVPATRNSILTWFLGLPFDHVVVYHRALARFTLGLVLLHFVCSLFDPLDWGSGLVLFGLASGLCAIVIFGTSLNCMRRKHFNIFYYSHYAFIGFYGFAFAHVPDTRPFLIVGASLYMLDRVIRLFMNSIPSRALEFRPKGQNVTQVRFKKNPITQWAGMHKTGQYFFVNFPALSVLEWHPFSVSSGPREQDVEVHIRNLGDWTKQVNELSQKTAQQKLPLPWIRIEGPYGVHDLNYRRYEVLMLVGGGVGITPVMGIMKDIYNSGNYNAHNRRHVPPHIIDTVYAVWVVPQVEHSQTFISELKACLAHAEACPQLPKLCVWIYVTRPDGELQAPYIQGRPDFVSVFDEMQQTHTNAAIWSFACGPSVMVANLWDESVKRTARGARIDFHHETFEF